MAAAELNISCPNVDGDGMAWGMEPCGAARAVKTARAAWRGPLWVKLTPQAADAVGVAQAVDKLISDSVYNVDEIRQKLGDAPLNTWWSQQYTRTKNIEALPDKEPARLPDNGDDTE